jgi:hypothetical protein
VFGTELMSLIGAAPLLMVGGVLWSQRRRIASILVAGPALFVVYTYAAALGADDNELAWNWTDLLVRVLYTFVAIVGTYLIFVALAQMETAGTGAPAIRRARTLGLAFVGTGIGLIIAWIARLPWVFTGGPGESYLAGNALTCLYVVTIPVLLHTGIGLLHGDTFATTLSLIITPFLMLLGGSVVSAYIGRNLEMGLTPLTTVGFWISLCLTAAFVHFSWQLFSIHWHRQVRNPRKQRGPMMSCPPHGLSHK